MWRKPVETIHLATTRFFGHPAVKPVFTHTGIWGFGLDFAHAGSERLHVMLHWWAWYGPWRDLNIGWAAFALGLVIYCDNANHVLAAIRGPHYSEPPPTPIPKRRARRMRHKRK